MIGIHFPIITMQLAYNYARKYSRIKPAKLPIKLSFVTSYKSNVLCFQQRPFKDNNEMDNKFIVKTCTSKDMLVAELFGSHIGNSVGIDMSKATVLPSNTLFEKGGKQLTYDLIVSMIRENDPDDIWYESILLLITHVPGNPFHHGPGDPFHNAINIERLLLNEKLSSYQNLCNLSAVDIFVSNNDRHGRNVYYDKNTDKFYGIDMDNAFYVLKFLSSLFGTNFEKLTSLDDLTSDKAKIKELLSRNNQAFKACNFLSQCERKRLFRYQRTALRTINIMLKKLSKLYPLEKMYDLWLSKCKNVGWEVNYAQKTLFKKMFEVNYYWVVKVMKILDYLIGKTMCIDYREIVILE